MNFSTLYMLVGYNNYINRKLKFENNINLYMEFDPYIFENVNFNPNDEVNAEVILDYDDILNAPDYLVVADNENNITGRWYITDRVRIRGNQWKFTLRRDVVADYWNIIKSAPCFIEKAMLNINNPLIFNNEDMTFNQIKENEELLYDNTRCPWIVGYISKKVDTDHGYLQGNLYSNAATELGAISLGTTIEEWLDGYAYNISNLSDYSDELYYTNGDNFNIVFKIKNKFKTGTYKDYAHYKVAIDASGSLVSTEEVLSLMTTQKLKLTNTDKTKTSYSLAAELVNAISSNIFSYFSPITTTVNSPEQFDAYNTLSALNGKTIIDSNGKVFDLNLRQVGVEYESISVTQGTNLYSSFVSTINKAKANGAVEGTITADCFAVENIARDVYALDLKERKELESHYELKTRGILQTEDAPYNIFAIPYGAVRVLDENDQLIVETSADTAIKTAFALNQNHPGIIYDIQILPYCPVPSLNTGWAELAVDNEFQYSRILTDDDDSTIGVIFHVPRAAFSFNIDFMLIPEASAIEKKVASECTFYRLCSPNYSSYFDFNLQKNGRTDFFNVDCEYKPFTPYIHVNPIFSGLYGRDFNDPRGLICAGDFSIGQIIDQWQQYQIQNRNFQNIFDRQIENMNVTNKYQKELDIWSAVAGTLQGGVSGAATGLFMGGGAKGAIGGGIAGTVASAIAGIKDVQINEALRNEAVDFAKDQFGYQLGNIQALPNTISRVTAFNNNNKIVPVLEFYSCTDTEKEALRNKIKYNGMTVMTIGKIEDYVTVETSYIKGKIIQLPGLNDDFHVANTIVGEVNKGLYIEGGYLDG